MLTRGSLRSGEDFAKDVFEIDLFVADVFDLLRAAGFAFDGDGSGVTETTQLGEDFFEINEALADEHLFA